VFSATSNMRQRNMMTGSDMEQNSQSFVPHPEPRIGTNYLYPDIPPVNTVPHLEAHSLQEPYDNNSMFYGPPQYHHQHASNLGSGMSTAPNFYVPYVNYEAPPSFLLSHGSNDAVVGVTSTEHERNAHFMDHGFKRKSSEVIPGNSQYPVAPCSFPQLNTSETAPFSFPHFGTYPQPLDQRSVRNRAGAATMDPLLSHGHNNFSQGNYAAHPFPPLGSIWYDQHCNGNRSDGSSSLWSQAPAVPYMHGNIATGSIESGNVCFPRYHETSSSRNPTPSVYQRNHYISHHPVPPPPIVYPHMPSASYAETLHPASYSHMGQVQSTGFRINQYPGEDFVPAAILRHRELPHFRAMPANENAFWEVGDFYNAVNYVDHHQDMRLDIEDMSYEELLALSDQIGTVKTGLSSEDVKELLKRRTSTRINLEEGPSTDLETDSCTICQENYKNEDKIATLDCMHKYHAECLKKWLVIKNVCPICKSEALVIEKKKKLRLSSR